MVFGHVISPQRGNLSVQQSLHLANFFLDGAGKAQDRDIALVLCYETETTLFQAKKSAKRSDDQAVRQGIAVAYIGLGRVLDRHEHHTEAQAIYKKAEKMGVKVQEQGQLAQSLDPMHTKHNRQQTSCSADTTALEPSPTHGKRNQQNNIATAPPHIFSENVRPTTVAGKLPEPDERLANTPQLACCLALLKDSHSLDSILEPAARNWLQVVENDEDEQDRLKILATDVIRTFKKEEIKDAKAVSEVVCLAPVLEKDAFRDLLMEFYNGVDHSGLLDFHQLEGLAQMIQGADPGHLHADDLVKILELLATRLQNTHKQSPQHMFQLILAASYVLDAMADTRVKGLDRETLHQPLMSYLDSLKGSTDPFMMYQVAYAYQALLCVPDNETPWQATLRRTTKVVQGVSGLVSAVKGLDLNGFIDGLKDIQQGLAGASEMVKTVVTVFNDVKSLASGSQHFLDGLKEGFSFQRKCAWYPALRGADTFIRDGDFVAFKQLVYEAPCQLDLAFQWGVCQRLGEIAINPTWDVRTRRSAATLLGEIYLNDEDWGDQASIKESIVAILTRLGSSTGNISQFAVSLLRELQSYTEAKQQRTLQDHQKDPITYPLRLTLPPLGSPSLLDRVQNKPDVEATLRLLRKQRLKERGEAVYIHPQAKSSLQASDDARFPLTEKVKEFLGSEQKVFLLLGDSGAGKSTFNRQLECDLWQGYKKNIGRIPLHINLPAIDKPEQDMITKQLRKSEFTEPEIRELKTHRRFILICDGYDESQQTHNLYMSNRLNQEGEWKVQMIISCRTEYLGVDYRDRFQPGDRNRASDPGQYQEAVITPFSENQVHDYIKQYVSVHQPLWEVKEYTRTLDLIPSLKELVKNPFLMALSLEVLPRMVDPGEHLSATRVTRVALYDQFIEHWLERGKKRLGEKELTPQAKSAFEGLVEEGFTRNGIDFLKRLAVSIYKEQRGQPIVLYSRFQDEGSWKAAFFGREDEKQLLREASPLTRSGNQHRFIHRSLLEYALALSIFDPQVWKEKPAPTLISGRRGSTDSTYSFQSDDDPEVSPPIERDHEINSPLAWRNLLKDPSVLQFLTERVRQEPVFKKQLLTYIQLSKTDPEWRKAASNAITILVRAGVKFHGADLRDIKIPGADLSYGMFDSVQLQDSDLRRVSLRGVWMRQADLSDAQMGGVHFGELPYLAQDSSAYSCAYSVDGTSLAVGLGSGDIRVYSTSSWEETQTLRGHTQTVQQVTYSPNGHQLASASFDSTVRLWDVQGNCTCILIGHTDSVLSIAYSPGGATLATGSWDKTMRVWDVDTGTCRFTMTGHTGYVLSVVYSPDGNQLASGSADNTIRLHDSKTGECLHVLRQSTWQWSVSYSPQGDRIASGSGTSLRLWDTRTGDLCREFTGHSDKLCGIVFSPQGDMIASAGSDKTVRIWDTESGGNRQIFTGHTGGVQCVVFSPCGGYIISGGDDSTVRLWVVGSEVTTLASDSNTSPTSCVRYSPQRYQAAVASFDGTIRLRDVKTGLCLHTLSGHINSVPSMDYSPCGNLLASGGFDCTVRIWDTDTGECRQILIGHTYSVELVALSTQGRHVGSITIGGEVKLWNLETGESIHIISFFGVWLSFLVYSPSGNRIASKGYMHNLRIWDAETGVCLHTLGDSTTIIIDVVYSPRGDTVATASKDGTVRVWNTENGKCLLILVGHCSRDSDKMNVIAYSSQGNQLVSGGEDGIMKLWDVDGGCCIHTLVDHTKNISCIRYSPDDRRVVSASDDKTVRLWDVASGECLSAIRGFHGRIIDMAWDSTSDVNHLVTIMYDGSSHYWNVTETEGQYHIYLVQGSTNGMLDVSDACIQGVRGLSQINKQLLQQRGAVGEPFHQLREASKKMINMASVVSKLRQTSSGVRPESMSFSYPAEG